MDFTVSPEAQTIFLDEMKAIPVLKMDSFDAPTIEKLGGLKLSDFRTYSIGDLGSELNKMWQEEIPTLNQ